MKHRILLSLAAAAVMAFSMGTAAPRPAEAGIHIYLGTGHSHHLLYFATGLGLEGKQSEGNQENG